MLVLLSGSLVSPIAILSAFATIQTASLHPTALNATAVSGTKIFLMWTAPINATQDGVSGYKIEMRPSCSGFFNFLVNRSEEHTSELQSRPHLVCRLLLEKKDR